MRSARVREPLMRVNSADTVARPAEPAVCGVGTCRSQEKARDERSSGSSWFSLSWASWGWTCCSPCGR